LELEPEEPISPDEGMTERGKMESPDLELKMSLNRLWAKEIFFLVVGMILFITGLLSSILYSMVRGGMYPPPTPYPLIGVAIMGVILIDIGMVIRYKMHGLKKRCLKKP
jgi:hypothetical protein